jgi:hypothetical protein
MIARSLMIVAEKDRIDLLFAIGREINGLAPTSVWAYEPSAAGRVSPRKRAGCVSSTARCPNGVKAGIELDALKSSRNAAVVCSDHCSRKDPGKATAQAQTSGRRAFRAQLYRRRLGRGCALSSSAPVKSRRRDGRNIRVSLGRNRCLSRSGSSVRSAPPLPSRTVTFPSR